MKTKNFDYNIESLRGFSALFVVIGHLLEKGKYIDNEYFPQQLTNFITPAHTSVLIFFVLSGYVIGITTKTNLKSNQIIPYLKKRLLRLYPIYFICIILTLLIIPYTYPLTVIFGNLTFLQIICTPVIYEINPIWSLHYEVIFYLLFIPISIFNLNPIIVLLISFTLGITNYFIFPQSALFTTLCFGFCFWVSGLAIAQFFPKKEEISQTNYNLLLSNILLILCLEHYNILNTILSKITHNLFNHQFNFPNSIDWYKQAIPFLNFSFLPYCILFILVFSGKLFKFKRKLLLLFQLLPAITLIHIFTNFNNETIETFLIPTFYYAFSLLFFFLPVTYSRASKLVMKIGLWIGSLSYGIYLIHYPIMVLIHQIDFFTGSLTSYLTRIVVFFFLTFFVAYLLEKKIHPSIIKLIGSIFHLRVTFTKHERTTKEKCID